MLFTATPSMRPNLPPPIPFPSLFLPSLPILSLLISKIQYAHQPLPNPKPQPLLSFARSQPFLTTSLSIDHIPIQRLLFHFSPFLLPPKHRPNLHKPAHPLPGNTKSTQ